MTILYPPTSHRDARSRCAPRRGACGFTLIEVTLAIAIIGTGILALVELLAVGTMANRESADSTTGLNLTKNIRELSMTLAFSDPVTRTVWGLDSGESATLPSGFDDVNDLAARTFDPPIDSQGRVLNDFSGWSQAIVVEAVEPGNLTSVRPNGSTKANRVTVTVRHNGRQVSQLRWFEFNGQP